MELGVLGEQLQFLVQNLQALLGDIIRHHVIDADLHVLEAGPVQALDACGGQEISVGDHARHHAALADVGDDLVQLRMHQRLAATDRHHGCAQRV